MVLRILCLHIFLNTREMKTSYSPNSKTLLLVLGFLIILTSAHGAPVNCEPGFYFDKITGKCDHCQDICHRAKQQRTTEKCHRLCPNFIETAKLSARKCFKNFYYDPSVDRCEPCSTLCTDATSRGQLHDCRTKCPDWFDHGDGKPTQTSQPVRYFENGDTDEKVSDAVPIWVVPVAIGALVLVCMVPAVWFRRIIFDKIKNLCLCSLRRHPRRSEQVDTAESTCTYGPVGLGPLPTQTLLETQV